MTAAVPTPLRGNLRRALRRGCTRLRRAWHRAPRPAAASPGPAAVPPLAFALLAALCAGLWAGQAPGQTVGSADVGRPVLATSDDAATLAGFGGAEGIGRVVNRGIDLVLADPRISQRFANANIPRLKQMLTVQFCALLHGPCRYEGADMRTAHAGMNIRLAEFNALAEDFQTAMTELGVPYIYQTRLVALLAPMQRDMTSR